MIAINTTLNIAVYGKSIEEVKDLIFRAYGKIAKDWKFSIESKEARND